MKKMLAAILSTLHFPGWAHASDAQIEKYAQMAASAANKHLQKSPPDDGVIVSIRAHSEGKAVVYESVIAMQPNTTDTERAAWLSANRKAVIAAARPALEQDRHYKNGLHFRYRYFDPHGKVIDDFLVNQHACGD